MGFTELFIKKSLADFWLIWLIRGGHLADSGRFWLIRGVIWLIFFSQNRIKWKIEFEK